ncbi:MAG: hypothetical protein AB7W59_29590 [Acidimicrobiia bacterium]
MSLPWFYDEVAVDHAALFALQQAATAAAAAVERAAAERLRTASQHLRYCAGPYAEDLADAVLRAGAVDGDLIERCLALAAQAVAAGDAARTEQARRLALQETYELELARDEAHAAARATGVPA